MIRLSSMGDKSLLMYSQEAASPENRKKFENLFGEQVELTRSSLERAANSGLYLGREISLCEDLLSDYARFEIASRFRQIRESCELKGKILSEGGWARVSKCPDFYCNGEPDWSMHRLSTSENGRGEWRRKLDNEFIYRKAMVLAEVIGQEVGYE